MRFQNTLRYSETFVKEIKENIEHLEKFQSNKTSNISSDFNFKKILIKNITFSYEKNLILDDTELDIELNKFVSISGLSGSGKTTLLNIVCGFIEPQNYKIFFDGKEFDSKTKLSNLIAYVPQDKFVFEGEVWKNISLEYDKKNCNFNKINEVLKLVRLKINPEFELFSNGQNLSGGQKQRLILARALYFSKKIIILDESTNELDDEVEGQILNDFKKIKGIAVVIVSHKKSTIKFCDKKYNLEDKKLILQ